MSKKQNYIDGAWVDGAETASNVNSSNISDVIGDYAKANAAQTETAIAAARTAFQNGPTPRVPRRVA